MLSHIDKRVNDKFLAWLNCKYGEHAEVTLTRGDKHEYLGMKFTFRDRKNTMDDTGKAKEILEEFPIMFKDKELEKISTPAATDMFDKGTGKCLDTEKHKLFH